jgi:hypothetical protein
MHAAKYHQAIIPKQNQYQAIKRRRLLRTVKINETASDADAVRAGR